MKRVFSVLAWLLLLWGCRVVPGASARIREPSPVPLSPTPREISEAVQEAAAAKSPWIGFRLEAAPSAADGTGWRWRTAEFAEANGKQFCPTLTVVTE